MPDTPDLFTQIDTYIDDLFAHEDEILTSAIQESKSAGLPSIQVSSGQGKFIHLLAKTISAKRILEIGTLGGYSTIWLARALPPDGRLVTLEYDPKHAQVATKNIAKAGFSQQVEVIVGPAIDTLPKVVAGPDAPFDLVFLDADKVNYVNYFPHIMQAVHSGSLLLADNVIRKSAVLAPKLDDPAAAATRAFNAMLATDNRLESIILQQVGIKGHDGLAIARIK